MNDLMNHMITSARRIATIIINRTRISLVARDYDGDDDDLVGDECQ
jgi:hypothetical protein